ncbi:MAG: S8 family serine peptidase [Chloroflexi bacterium]|nr:S8 family serine peptidase [Chloroflexota bacterium]
MDAIQVEQAWDLSTGVGATVAVLDTGVAYANLVSTVTGELVFAQAPDLAGVSFVAPYDAYWNDLIPQDDDGHGTHVTGTIAQRTNNSMGVAGVAHDSAIMPVKVCGALGCPSSAIANGITWAVNNGADVINMSLGGPSVSQVERDAVAYAESNDVVVVAAAGNGGEDGVGDAAIEYPGALPTVISVGAVRFDQTRSSYSNYGSAEGGTSHLHLVGPGGDMSVDQNGDTYGDGVLQNTYLHMCSSEPVDFTIHAYCFLQGTSMASPHVAGVAGLLRSEYPSITAAQIREVLRCSSLDLGASGYDSEYGAGLVQAFEALNDTDNNGVPDCLDTPTPTPSPSPSDADGDGVPDSTDNCPNWYNPLQHLPPWPIATDDPDCDGFSTTTELGIGTDPLIQCPLALGNPDAWPPDLASPRNGVINILDVSLLRPVFRSSAGDGIYDVRMDISGPDGEINILDVSAFKPFFFKSCTP